MQLNYLSLAGAALMSLMGCDIHVINPEWVPHALHAPCIEICIDI